LGLRLPCTKIADEPGVAYPRRKTNFGLNTRLTLLLAARRLIHPKQMKNLMKPQNTTKNAYSILLFPAMLPLILQLISEQGRIVFTSTDMGTAAEFR
jgi:hypothetical protein